MKAKKKKSKRVKKTAACQVEISPLLLLRLKQSTRLGIKS